LPTVNPSSAGDHLEQLLAQAVQVLEQRGEPGLQEFLTTHHSRAEALRDGLERLRRLGILAPPSALPEQRIRFGEFRVLRRIGAGGMGVVYAAEQASLHRTVALKVVRPEFLLSASARERFQREIDAIARLNHPGIVPILAVGDDEAHPWFAMEYVEGQTLDQLLRPLQGRDPARLDGQALRSAFVSSGKLQDSASAFTGSYWEACVRMVQQVAQTMSYVHERGILHRDLKPSNVIVTRQGQPKLVDFGLARVHDLQRVTRDRTPVGSPAYSAPELLRGEASDERGDIYGLGVTLYELLTTHLPFEHESLEALQQAILAGGARPVRSWNRAVPRDLDVVCAVALDRDPARRYRSMAEFAADLERVLQRLPITARPLGRGLRLVRLLQRHPTWSVLAGAVCLLALQFPLLLWRQQAAANVELQRSNAALAAANDELLVQRGRAEAGFADALAAVRRTLLIATEDHVVTAPGSEQVQFEMLREASAMFETLRRRHPGRAALEVDAAHTLGRLATLHEQRGEPERARQLRDEAMVRLAGIPGPTAMLFLGGIARWAADERGAVGDVSAQLGYAEAAWCAAERGLAMLPRDRRLRANAVEAGAAMASALGAKGDTEAQREWLLRAEQDAEALFAEYPDQPEVAVALASLHSKAAIAQRSRAPGAARRAVDRGLQVIASVVPRGRNELWCRRLLADLHEVDACLRADAEEFAASVGGHGRALALRASVLADFPMHPGHRLDLGRSLFNLAMVHARLGDFEFAFACWRDSIRTYQDGSPPVGRHADQHARGLEVAVATFCTRLLEQHEADQLAQWLPVYDRAARSPAAVLEVARLACGLGELLATRDGWDAAQPWRERALDLIERAIGADRFARSHFERGQHAAAYEPIRGWPSFQAALQWLEQRRSQAPDRRDAPRLTR
jgi:hypothetical protein